MDIFSVLLIFIGLFIIGIIIEIAISKSKWLKSLNKLKDLTTREKPKPHPYKLSPEQKDSVQIERICTRLINNYRIIVAIHGILLAFVISSGKILLIFSSWYFVIWCGLILATIIRSGKYSIALIDIQETQGDKLALDKCYAAKKFYNTSLAILIILVILLPSIYLLEEPTYLITNSSPAFHMSLISSSATLGTSFALFFFVVFRFTDSDFYYKEWNIIAFTLIIITLGAYLYANSPTQEIPIFLTNGDQINLPFILFSLPIFGLLYGVIKIFHLVNLLMMLLPDKALKFYASFFLR